MNYVPSLNPSCCSCGCAIHDSGAEQTDAWLASMCPECHEANAVIEDDSDYYGGDSVGSYGPSDPRFNREA